MRSTEQYAARLLPLCFVFGCQGETTTPTPVSMSPGSATALVTDNVVASVAVTPDSQLVFWGTLFQVAAQPRNAAGEALDRIPTWTVGNTTLVRLQGTPQANMTFKALKVGTTSVTATVDGRSRSSKVVVRGTTDAKVVITPAEATVEGGGTVQFAASGRTRTGETAVVNVTWTTTGGTITGAGVLTAPLEPGTYRVIGRAAFGAADTSLVTVSGPAGDPVAAVILVPETAALQAGETVQFEAYGQTEGGDSVPVGVSYTAAGGTIGGGGLYTAGGASGTYRVIAASAAGVADTSEVTVAGATIARVTLRPDIAASRTGETTRFTAAVWNTLDEQVAEPVEYEATCGSVTGAGVFTAPGGPGTCLVTASAGGRSASVEVVVLRSSLDQGIPFGSYDLWTSATKTQTTGGSPFTGSHDYVLPGEMVNHIALARAKGMSIVLAMTGGSHDRYKTNGVFDEAKWRAAVDGYGTPAIRAAIADGVADGTIIGNSVMDEPQQSGTGSKSWGPAGTMTKARVDGLCGYVKQIFPTLPVGVGHDHAAFQPSNSYQVCEFFMAQYAARKGGVVAYRDAALAMADRDGMVVLFSMNLLNGGVQDKSGAWDCPGTGGLGDRSPNCRMTAAQVRDFGKTLGQAGCAMLSWKFDKDFVAKVENQEAFSDIAITLSRLPRIRCSRRS
jgi:hypothetical protein